MSVSSIVVSAPYDITDSEAKVDIAVTVVLTGNGITKNAGDTGSIALVWDNPFVGTGDAFKYLFSHSTLSSGNIAKTANGFTARTDFSDYEFTATYNYTVIVPRGTKNFDTNYNFRLYGVATEYTGVGSALDFLPTVYSNTVVINYPEPVVCTIGIASVQSQTESAGGAGDGFIIGAATGNQGTLTWTLTNILIGSIQNGTGDFQDLQPGNYTLTVEDDIVGGCTDSVEIVLEQPAIEPREIFNNIIVEIREKCEDDSIYLAWQNTKGGFSYWLFDNKSDTFEYKLKTRSGSEIQRPVEKLDESIVFNEVISKEATESIKLGADNLSEDHINGIKKIFSSPRVLMLISPPSERPPRWINVNVRDTTFSYLKRNSSIEFEIELPLRFLQSN